AGAPVTVDVRIQVDASRSAVVRLHYPFRREGILHAAEPVDRVGEIDLRAGDRRTHADRAAFGVQARLRAGQSETERRGVARAQDVDRLGERGRIVGAYRSGGEVWRVELLPVEGSLRIEG